MERRLYIAALLIFLLASALTLYSAESMSGAMAMPGGWTMGMTWMRMPGQSWFGAGFMFAWMWLAMMVAMMLPSSLPMLLLYRRVIRFRNEPHPAVLVWLLGGSYFLVWVLFGIVAYGAGISIASAAMHSAWVSRAIPAAAGLALIVAGMYQVTPWKSACLQHCRDPLEVVAQHLHAGWKGAVHLGVHHGLFCAACCWALMLMQLVVGVMNLVAMAVIGTVIALEKMTSRGDLIARAVGVSSIVVGLTYLLRIF